MAHIKISPEKILQELATAQSGEYTARAIPVFDWGEEDFAIHGDLSVDGRVLVDNTPVLNTPFVQTCCWSVEGLSRCRVCSSICLMGMIAAPLWQWCRVPPSR